MGKYEHLIKLVVGKGRNSKVANLMLEFVLDIAYEHIMSSMSIDKKDIRFITVEVESKELKNWIIS